MNHEVQKDIELLYLKTEKLIKRKIHNALLNDYLGEIINEKLKERMRRDVDYYTRSLPTTYIHNHFMSLIDDIRI